MASLKNNFYIKIKLLCETKITYNWLYGFFSSLDTRKPFFTFDQWGEKVIKPLHKIELANIFSWLNYIYTGIF